MSELLHVNREGCKGNAIYRNCVKRCWSGGVGAVELFDANQIIPGFARESVRPFVNVSRPPIVSSQCGIDISFVAFEQIAQETCAGHDILFGVKGVIYA